MNPPDLLLQEDVFNSKHFGLHMANLILSPAAALLPLGQATSLAKDGLSQARRQGIQHLCAKVATHQKVLAQALCSQGFYLVDTLITYRYHYGTAQLPQRDYQVQIQEAAPADLPALQDIARDSFRIDRFHSDPALPKALSDSYYAQWITNACTGGADRVFVAREAGQAIGFITLKLDPLQGINRVVLNAVAASQRGRGHYTSLMHKALAWTQGLEPLATELLVGTQIENLAAQRAWLRLGLLPHASQYVLHHSLI